MNWSKVDEWVEKEGNKAISISPLENKKYEVRFLLNGDTFYVVNIDSMTEKEDWMRAWCLLGYDVYYL